MKCLNCKFYKQRMLPVGAKFGYIKPQPTGACEVISHAFNLSYEYPDGMTVYESFGCVFHRKTNKKRISTNSDELIYNEKEYKRLAKFGIFF